MKNKNLKNNYIKKHQKTPKSKTKKTKQNTKQQKQKNRIPSILEEYTFFLKDKKINRTVTVATHFSKDLHQ